MSSLSPFDAVYQLPSPLLDGCRTRLSHLGIFRTAMFSPTAIQYFSRKRRAWIWNFGLRLLLILYDDFKPCVSPLCTFPTAKLDTDRADTKWMRFCYTRDDLYIRFDYGSLLGEHNRVLGFSGIQAFEVSSSNFISLLPLFGDCFFLRDSSQIDELKIHKNILHLTFRDFKHD